MIPRLHGPAGPLWATDLRGAQPDPHVSAPPHTPRYDEYLRRTLPCRQKAAKAFLEGTSPGVMQSYAPDAKPEKDGWVEDDETVRRLMKWREQAIH